MKPFLLSLLTVAGLVAGCGESNDPADPATMGDQGKGTASDSAAAGEADSAAAGQASGDQGSASRRRGPRLVLRDSQFGPVLFDGRDRALYLFTRDPKRRTRCYGDCAEAWPPFYAQGRPRAGRGVDRSLIGTIRRRDGRRQVTYKGQPLYFYVHDPKGEVLCNNVVEFGGTWFAVNAAGTPPA